jgi:zinc transport system substrate-binding protein
MSIAPNMPRDIIGFENLHNRVHLTALKMGLTQVVFHWLVNGNIRFSTPAINIQVGENTSAYGLYDPHIWMDPINVLQMVDDIQHAFIDLLPENALYFNEKADAYKRAIEDVHERYRYVFANTEITTMMHGGHNVFGYLTNRYNLDYVNPYRGFSPDAEPTPQAIVTMIERMRADNITHLFSEALIDPKVADLLLRETGAQILYVYAGENIPSQLLNEGFSFIDLLDSNLEQFKIGLRYRGNESAH